MAAVVPMITEVAGIRTLYIMTMISTIKKE